MKITRHITAIAALALVTAPVQARVPDEEGWTQIDDNAEETYFIRDKDWMAGRPDTTSALVWTWVHRKRDRRVSHNMILLEINCPAEAYRFVQLQEFSHTGRSTSLGSTEWEFAPPSTIISEIVRATCLEPSTPKPSWEA